jgi:hypothetical protein
MDIADTVSKPMIGLTSQMRVNVFLALFLPALAIDAFHPINDFHRAVEDKLDTLLDVTGLWQGPWRLYAPDVDRMNLRLAAEIHFVDGEISTWDSPNWVELSPLQKFVEARHVNYFNHVLQRDRQTEWDGLGAYLARTVPHPKRAQVAVEAVVLKLRGAIIPDPAERVVPAEPYAEADPPVVIYVWRAPPP